MADVYLAVARGPGGFSKLQVIKRLRPHLAEEPSFLRMFLDEARLAARLNHPNVVQTNEVGEANGKHYIVMEYLDGQPLNRILNRAVGSRNLPLAHYLSMLTQALTGLEHAHELADFDGTPLHVVHRDLSPHNIFVTYDGVTKLVDFGIAKAATRSADTRDGVLKGKVAYMSPEQARSASIDRRADLFALGVLLWEIVAGRRLWDGLSDLEVIERLTTGQIPRLKQVLPEAPDELDAICQRALAANPDQRYAHASEMRDAIDAYVRGLGQRPTVNDIGKCVTALFAAERAEIRSIIERRLSGLDPNEDTDIGRSEEDEDTGSIPLLVTGVGAGQRTPSHQSASGRGISRTTSGASGTTPKRARGGWWVGAALAALTVAAGIGLWLATRPAPAAPVTEPASAPVEQPAEPAAKPELRLSVRATPENAEIYVDDSPVGENPYAAKFARDGIAHRIRAEAPGFVSQSKIVVFDQDRNIAFELVATPDASAPVASSKPAGPRRRPAAKPAASAKPEQPSGPNLDVDPWAK